MGYLAISDKFAAYSGTGPALPSGENRLRFGIVFTGYQDSKAAASAFTFGGVAGTKITTASVNADQTGGEVFFWDEEDMSSMEGTAFAVTGPTTPRRFVVFVDFDDMDQVTGLVDSGLGTDILDVQADDIILSFAFGRASNTSPSWAPADSQTEILEDFDPTLTGATSVIGVVGYEVATGSTHGFSWAPTQIEVGGSGGLAIRPAASGSFEDLIPEQADWGTGVKAISPGVFNVDWDGMIAHPWAVVEKDGTKYLYYEGSLNDTTPDFRAIGVATSTDNGNSWTKNPSNPVFFHNPGGGTSPEEGAVSAAVLVDGDTFHAWYSANVDVGMDQVDMHVRYANSTDGVNFTNDISMLETAEYEYWAQAAIKIGDTFYLFLTIIDGVAGAAGGRGPLYVVSGTDPAALGNLTLVDEGPWSHMRIVDLTEDQFVADLSVNNVPFVWDWYSFEKSAPTVISGPLAGKQTQLTTDGHLGRTYDVDPETNHWRVYHLRWWTGEGWPPGDDGIYRFNAFTPPALWTRTVITKQNDII